jgi:two-component system OmpR family response regulator
MAILTEDFMSSGAIGPRLDVDALHEKGKNCPHRKVILCIDDNDGILMYHQALLERVGFEVLAVTSAIRGLEIASECPVSAVIVDYNMPEMNGHKVATAIKSIKPHIPIVLVSSDDDIPEDVLNVVDAFVPKDDAHVRLLPLLTRICAGS